MKQIVLLIFVGLLSLSMGCSASITRYGYNINEITATIPECDDIIIKKKVTLSGNNTIVVGKIEAADSGFSTACSEEYVLNIFKRDAYALGAHIINITEDAQPSIWSTCYRATAEFDKAQGYSLHPKHEI